MPTSKRTKQRRQRPKNGDKRPRWPCKSRLLRGIFLIVPYIYRMLRLLWTLKEMFWG